MGIFLLIFFSENSNHGIILIAFFLFLLITAIVILCMVRKLKKFELEYFQSREVSLIKIATKFLSEYKKSNLDKLSSMNNTYMKPYETLGFSVDEISILKSTVGKFGAWIMVHTGKLESDWQKHSANYEKLSNSKNRKIAPVIEVAATEVKTIFSRKKTQAKKGLSSARSPRKQPFGSQKSLTSSQGQTPPADSLKSSLVVADLNLARDKISPSPEIN